MAGKVVWNDVAVLAAIERQMRPRLAAAAILVANRAKDLIGREGALPRLKALPATRGHSAKAKGSLAYGARRSLPGEPPMKQTGRLQSSVAWEIIGLVARIGTNVGYGKILEFGARRAHLAARPWLRRALREVLPDVRKVLSAPLGSFSNPIDVTWSQS